MSLRLLILAVLILVAAGICNAGNTGKISGQVTDAKSKEPLIAANILVEGTTLGAATDVEGRYFIINIPPGTYNLKVSVLGYGPVSVTGLQVFTGLTTKQDFSLTESIVEQKEVVITAERPLVQKDMTATTAIVNKELISKLAVTEVKDLVQLQAGITVSGGDIHLRGGRKGQIAYQIDGVPVTDAYDGSNTIDVGTNVIQELQVISGAFNAEYGQAMSGVVNIITRDGDNNFSGNFQTYTGSYVSNKSDMFWNLGSIKPTSLRSFEGTFSGPIVKDKLTFFANGRYYYNTGYLFGKKIFNPDDIAFENPTSNLGDWIILNTGDGQYVPMNSNERIYAQGKLSYRYLPNLKFSYNYIYDFQRYQDYDGGNRLTPDNNLHRFRKTHTNILSMNHSISTTSFYTLSLSYLYKDYKSYLYENIFTGDRARPTLYVDNNIRRFPPYSFNIGGTNANRFFRSTKTYEAKLDWTTQLNQEITLQYGGEFKRHEIYFQNINLVPKIVNGQQAVPYSVQIPPITSQDYDQYLHKPMETSFYLQSKYEGNHVIFNVGLRFDTFNPDADILSDPTDPDILNPLRPNNQFNDLNGNGVFDPSSGETIKSVSDRQAYWFQKASVKTQISPRVGLAFPISANGVAHFSYGHFFQLPGYELLYTNPGFKLGIGSGNQGLFGNADLQPQKTIKGEIGIKQQLSDEIAGDITLFFEDFRNLTGTQTEDILVFTQDRSYSKYSNSDFGLSKGIIVSLERKLVDGFAMNLYYTYSITNGNASNPADARNAVLGGALPETYITPLDWDQRHTLNIIAAYTQPQNYGVSIIANYSSGQPYTPGVNKNSSIKKNAFPTNSAFRPNLFNIDLKANKDFSFGSYSFSIFLRVFNLLNLDNPRSVNANSGDPKFNFDELAARNTNPKLYYNTLEEFYSNPGNFSEPRRIEIGTSIGF